MMQIDTPQRSCLQKNACFTHKDESSNSVETTSSRGIDEIVLDLLRGKVAQCFEQIQQKGNRQQLFHLKLF